MLQFIQRKIDCASVTEFCMQDNKSVSTVRGSDYNCECSLLVMMYEQSVVKNPLMKHGVTRTQKKDVIYKYCIV